MVNSPLIRPYLLGETWHWGGTLGSHDTTPQKPGLAEVSIVPGVPSNC